MKTIITLIILALVGWGIWWFATNNDDLGSDNPAAAGQGLDFGADASLDTEAEGDVDLSEFEDKG